MTHKNLLRHTVWNRSNIPLEDYKYRNLQRVWLPLYDVIAIYAGVMGVLFGSPVLGEVFDGDRHGVIDPVDLATGTFTVVAIACLVCVIHPRLWAFEIVAKVLLVGMIGAYIFSVIAFGVRDAAGIPNLFVTGMLAFGLPLAMFRLDLLGQDVAEHRLVRESLAERGQ